MTVNTITITIGATGLAALLCLGAARDARAEETIDAKFQMMDTNGDGKISAEESEEVSEKLFDKMDANDDDKLTVTEMQSAHDQKMAGKPGGKGPSHMTVTEKIKMMDTNKDGVVSEDEFEASAKLRFDNLDADKDGYVTKAELKAGHDKMMQKGQSK